MTRSVELAALLFVHSWARLGKDDDDDEDQCPWPCQTKSGLQAGTWRVPSPQPPQQNK